jgi:hypothetical protein
MGLEYGDRKLLSNVGKFTERCSFIHTQKNSNGYQYLIKGAPKGLGSGPGSLCNDPVPCGSWPSLLTPQHETIKSNFLQPSDQIAVLI